MDILIVNPIFRYLRGGAEVNDLNLGMALRGLGHDVTHVDVLDPSRPGPAHGDDLPVESVHMPFYFGAGGLLGPLGHKMARQAFFWDFLGRLVRQQRERLARADLILLTGKPLLSRVARHVDTTVLLSVRGPTRRWGLPMARRAGSGVIFWGGCEEDHDPALLKGLDSIALNPAVEKHIFHPGPASPTWRERLAMGSDKAVVLTSVARLDPVNQTQCIIRAVASLSDPGRVRLHIVGDGSLRAELERLAADLLPGLAAFHGRLDRQEVGEVLRASDLFVMYPNWNNHPIALMEALSCGLYAIAPRTGRIPRIMAGAPGLVVEGNRQKVLDQALAQALEDRPWQRRGTAVDLPGIRSWEENARQILDFATRLRKGPPRAATRP